MMYCKPIYFSNSDSAFMIMAISSPKDQKTLGRHIEGWDEFLWREVCERVVCEGNWWKLTQIPARREIMLAIGEREICEASRKDRRWGIGYIEF
jgi:ribA/ribD-fused uncharacterized protein